MSSNLIQNYISSNNTVSKSGQYNKPAITEIKPKPEFDIQKELDNRTFIKPLKAKGKLIDENIFLAPKLKFDNITYNLKSLKHALKGDANDHELGKINDVGLVAGGLAIASYLWTKRVTPMTKGMEFIGLGGFLASMALWPKLAIQLPAYLIHGVNVQKKYKDSFGRTKPFYQDPQFIPWDLYSDEQIERIGNRMGVPKNIPNRRAFIQEKMRKLAVQNNTLWMLTAGFATPVMTGLMCTAAKPYLNSYMDKYRNKKADAILEDLNLASKKYQTHEIANKLKILNRANLNSPITDELIDNISQIFTPNMDFVTSENFKKDLKIFLSDDKYLITDDTAKNIAINLTEIFGGKRYSSEFLNDVLISEQDMVRIFKDNGFLNKSLKPIEMQDIKLLITNTISERVKQYNLVHPDKAEDLAYIRTLINGNTKKNSIIKELLKNPSNIFDTTTQARLNNIAKIFDDFYAKNSALDEYALLKVGSAPETVIANYWNETADKFLDTLGITKKELEKVRFDKNLMGNLLRERIETIASDKSLYERVMRSIVSQVAVLDSKIKSSDMSSHLLRGENSNAAKTSYDKAVDTLFDSYSDIFSQKGFTRTADSISGHNGNTLGSYKNIQKAFVEERLLGVKSSFYRLISTLDFYRRAASNPNAMQGYNIIPREVKEELIELCKTISLRGHSSDYATKFYMLRNPNPTDDYSDIEVENGKIKYKYFGKASGKADISGDKFFYQNAMKFMHGDDMHSETKAIIDECSSIKDEIYNYRKLVFDRVGGEKYFFKPRHRVSANNGTGSDIKFLLTGIAPEELFFKQGQQMFNTKKWLSIFGKFGAGLLGITIFTQFLLGRIKAPKGGNND